MSFDFSRAFFRFYAAAGQYRIVYYADKDGNEWKIIIPASAKPRKRLTN